MRKRFSNVNNSEDEADIDITPMLDVVFIMLIFFIVTSPSSRNQVSTSTGRKQQQRSRKPRPTF